LDMVFDREAGALQDLKSTIRFLNFVNEGCWDAYFLWARIGGCEHAGISMPINQL
jgi:hypothetical protein